MTYFEKLGGGHNPLVTTLLYGFLEMNGTSTSMEEFKNRLCCSHWLQLKIQGYLFKVTIYYRLISLAQDP